jgi:CHAD domain-containing protein
MRFTRQPQTQQRRQTEPRRQGSGLALYAESKLAPRLKKISSTLRRAAKASEDPDHIHNLRVAIRRFTQALRVFKDLLDRARVRKMRRRLKKIMDLCGAVRNCDVALEVLRAAHIPANGPIHKRVRKTRSRIADDLRRSLTHSRGAKIKAWAGWLKAKPAGSQTVASAARRALVSQGAQFFKARNAAAKPEATDQQMHRFRLTGKRFRYTLEIFGPVAGRQWREQIEQIRGLQEHLGAINDCVVTRELIPQPNAALERLQRQRVAAFREYLSRHFQAESQRAWLAQFRKI